MAVVPDSEKTSPAISPDTLAAVQAEEKERGVTAWHFMTFMDGSEHLGAAMVEAYGPADALLAAAAKDIDPGRGRVVMTTLALQHLPAEGFRNRLLTKAEVESLWPQEGAKP